MQQTRAEYYENLVQHWQQTLLHQINYGLSIDYIVSTARMLAHFGQTALDSRKVEMIEGLIQRSLCSRPGCLVIDEREEQ